jgi:hypothetical protein
LDPLKIAIFLAAFALLLFIGRALARSSEIHSGVPLDNSLPASHPVPDIPAFSSGNDGERKPAATGRELGFPVKLPPVIRDKDDRYNRPNFLNYYFSKTDLVSGPADPTSFFDELHLEAQDPATEHIWTYEYTVATPSGMQQVMSTERFESLFFDGPVVIVSRWDLAVILQTVTEEIMKSYGKPDEDIVSRRPVHGPQAG